MERLDGDLLGLSHPDRHDRAAVVGGDRARLTDLAVEALMNRDREKAKLVIDGDVELNRLEMEVEQAAVELLALQQPMARDLRFIIGAIKVSNDLERVGDHAVNIAESALRLADKPKVNIRIPEIEVMARRARKMTDVLNERAERAALDHV